MINGQPLGHTSADTDDADDVSWRATHVLQNRNCILGMRASGGRDVLVVAALSQAAPIEQDHAATFSHGPRDLGEGAVGVGAPADHDQDRRALTVDFVIEGDTAVGKRRHDAIVPTGVWAGDRA